MMVGAEMSRRQRFCYRSFILIVCVLLVHMWLKMTCDSGYRMVPNEKNKFIKGLDNKTYVYDRDMPLIFIGGVPRSGTTLTRVMLDAHPLIRCGAETRVIPRLLSMRSKMAQSSKEMARLKEAGITDEILDNALSAFVLEIIAKHGEAAQFLCNKDPFTLKASMYLSQLFPNSKFLLMIRDGRAVVHSIIYRMVTISGFNLGSYRDSLQKWNNAIDAMYHQCLRIGSSRCMPVYYEQLVLHPKVWMQKIMEFLEIPWDDAVLNHQNYVGKLGGISLSRTEKSTDQVIKPVNIEALSKWVGHFPDDVLKDMPKLAPMLERLGYDPLGNPPNYGKPDKVVSENTNNVKRNKKFWEHRVNAIREGVKMIPKLDDSVSLKEENIEAEKNFLLQNLKLS